MGLNRLGDTGVSYISNALKVNNTLEVIDLFDVDFQDEAAISLAEAILINRTLTNLRLANTKVSPNGSLPLLK